jgi:hypothetical protein
MKNPTLFFKENSSQLKKVAQTLASKDKKSMENLIAKGEQEKLEDNEVKFVLEKIPLNSFEKFNVKIKDKLKEFGLEEMVKGEFKEIQSEEGYSLEEEMKKLFGNQFSAANLCTILRKWFKEVNLLEEK